MRDVPAPSEVHDLVCRDGHGGALIEWLPPQPRTREPDLTERLAGAVVHVLELRRHAGTAQAARATRRAYVIIWALREVQARVGRHRRAARRAQGHRARMPRLHGEQCMLL